MKKLLTTILLLTSTAALAHPGHLTNESVHSFLHVEHIIAITAIVVVAYVVSVSRNK